MSEFPTDPFSPPVSQRSKRVWLHLLLFVLTFFTTTIAGILWVRPDLAGDLNNFTVGLPYSISLLFILTCHEFGHYFAARAHGVETTLPYFIPFPTIPPFSALFLNFGTFGAVIRTTSVVPSRKAMFDIGVAGPIAGFLASIAVLTYGFMNLPPRDYLLMIHPNYDFSINGIPGTDGLQLDFGSTLLFSGLRSFLPPSDGVFVPPMSEVYHYPYLCVGWFGLFVTALNLLPIGQFDGGHLIYTMFGDTHKKIARWTFYALLAMSAPALSDMVLRLMLGWATGQDQPQIVPFAEHSWSAWFLWAMISLYFVKLSHPPVPDESPLDDRRMIVGWLTVGIFILSFSPNPFVIVAP